MGSEFADSWGTDRAGGWFAETESMSAETDRAWQTARLAGESRRANPRSRLRSLLRHDDSSDVAQLSQQRVLQHLDEGASHVRHLARSLHAATYGDGGWDVTFRERWAAIVGGGIGSGLRVVLVAESDLDRLFGHVGGIGFEHRRQRAGGLGVFAGDLRGDDALGVVEVLILLHPVRLGHFAERLS